jgi:hypothetical protein
VILHDHATRLAGCRFGCGEARWHGLVGYLHGFCRPLQYSPMGIRVCGSGRRKMGKMMDGKIIFLEGMGGWGRLPPTRFATPAWQAAARVGPLGEASLPSLFRGALRAGWALGVPRRSNSLDLGFFAIAPLSKQAHG